MVKYNFNLNVVLFKAFMNNCLTFGRQSNSYRPRPSLLCRPRSTLPLKSLSNMNMPKLDRVDESNLPRPGVGVGVFVTSPNYPDCILLGKRKNSTGSGLYALPGGHLEFGESWEECGRREIMEETGLRLKDVSFAYVNNAVNRPTKYHYVTIFMKGEIDISYKVEPENTEPHKCEGWQWTQWQDIPAPDQLFWSLRVTLAEGFNLFKPKT